MVGESSHLSTGYGVYARNVLSRLHATGKYDIAELACYAHFSMPELQNVPWRVYGNLPSGNDKAEIDRYNPDAYPINQFGSWRYEEVLLHFQPDIVFDIRDFWMLNFEETSPFRDFYHWSIMPTVDSSPQEEQWIGTFCGADSVTTYTDFGNKTLKRQAGDKINLFERCSPGADLKIFQPIVNKAAHKQLMGFGADTIIIGTVMRNQKRKLFPDLFEAFQKFLDTQPALAKKAFLYCHTSYPDSGWDIPRMLKETGLGHKVLFTYICENCKFMFPSFFHDIRCACAKCGQFSAKLPTTQFGVSTEQLAAVYNLFDVYVQYAICEGFGMPAVEAAACGVPVMAVDYSAMEDVVRCTGGYPIKVERLFREAETHAYRAYPDNDHLLSSLAQFFGLPEPIRRKKGFQARQGVEKHFTWEHTAKVWETNFDSVKVPDTAKTWKSPPRLHKPATEVPAKLSAEQLVNWGLVNVAGRPDLVNSYLAMRLIRDMHYGHQMQGFGGLYLDDASFLGQRPKFNKFGASELLNSLVQMAESRNHWEQRRVGMIQMAKPDYIRYVESKG